jgi:predicted RNA-binding protein with PUA-like domain
VVEEALPNYWFFLTDPESYHFDELFRKEREVWDGVFGTAAQKYLAELKKGDRVIGYHTAPGKQAYGILEAVSAAYQNPELGEKNWVVDVRGVKKLLRPVSLAELKASPRLKQMKLFKMFRPIAVSPLTPAEYKEICRLGGDRG